MPTTFDCILWTDLLGQRERERERERERDSKRERLTERVRQHGAETDRQ